jgi:hypothetical protein
MVVLPEVKVGPELQQEILSVHLEAVEFQTTTTAHKQHMAVVVAVAHFRTMRLKLLRQVLMAEAKVVTQFLLRQISQERMVKQIGAAEVAVELQLELD